MIIIICILFHQICLASLYTAQSKNCCFSSSSSSRVRCSIVQPRAIVKVTTKHNIRVNTLWPFVRSTKCSLSLALMGTEEERDQLNPIVFACACACVCVCVLLFLPQYASMLLTN